jgi:hypothetical protein
MLTLHRRDFRGRKFPRFVPLACAAILLLPGCLSAPIDRAADRADALVDRATAQARQIAQDALRDTDARMAALTADLAGKADAARAAALVDVDARFTAQRTALLADVDRQRAETLAALRTEREALTATVREESSAWREESAAWRAQAAPVLTALGGAGAAPGPSPAGPGGASTAELLITAGGAVASTLLIRYLDHKRKAAKAATESAT